MQGLIAVAQFVTQGSLGLSWMGESVFSPGTPGASVIDAAGRRWVRAYGLRIGRCQPVTFVVGEATAANSLSWGAIKALYR